MRTIEVNLYKFKELGKNSQQKAIEELSDININHDWWDFIYAEAEELGFKILSFDIGRGNQINIEFIDSSYDIATKIVDNHGEKCLTYKSAASFIEKHDYLVKTLSDGINFEKVAEVNEEEFDDKIEDIEEVFFCELKNNYLSLLRQEYDSRTSVKAIVDTIVLNEYEFTEDGKLY
jgi:hypothetical protein